MSSLPSRRVALPRQSLARESTWRWPFVPPLRCCWARIARCRALVVAPTTRAHDSWTASRCSCLRWPWRTSDTPCSLGTCCRWICARGASKTTLDAGKSKSRPAQTTPKRQQWWQPTNKRESTLAKNVVNTSWSCVNQTVFFFQSFSSTKHQQRLKKNQAFIIQFQQKRLTIQMAATISAPSHHSK